MSIDRGLESRSLPNHTSQLDLLSVTGNSAPHWNHPESPSTARILHGFAVGDFGRQLTDGYEIARNDQGMPTTVRDQSGRELRRFEYDIDGKTLLKAKDEKGSELKEIAFNDYRWVSPEGFVSGVTLSNVRVDAEANLHYRNENSVTAKGETVLKPDGSTETRLDSRREWENGTSVQPTRDGLIVRGLDGRALREITLNGHGKPQQVIDADGNRWDSTDGGSTIRRTAPDGSTYTYSNARLSVDSQGNISYETPYDQVVTETANGRLITKNRT